MRTRNGWRLAVRLSRRSMRTAPLQNLLTVLLIALPVAGAIAYAAVSVSSIPTPQDFARSYMGRADVQVSPGTSENTPHDAAGVSAVLGAVQQAVGSGARVTLDLRAPARFAAAVGPARGGLVGGTLRVLDLAHPLTDGMYRRARSAPSDAADQAAVSPALAERLGVGLGDVVRIDSIGRAVEVTAIVVDRRDTEALFLVTAGSPALIDAIFAAAPSSDVASVVSVVALADLPRPQAALAALDAAGLSVSTRDRLLEETRRYGDAEDPAVPALGMLVLILVEMGFLVAATLTIAAKRRQRELGLLAAAGAAPRMRRRVLVSHGLILGAVSAVLSVPVGLALGFAAAPLVARATHQEWSEFRINPLVTAVGPLLAVVVAVVAAWLTGRRVAAAGATESLRLGLARSPARRSPVPAAVCGVLAAGLLGYGRAARDTLAVVLGTVALATFLLAALAWALPRLRTWVDRWPLATRIALRDASSDGARSTALTAAIAAPFLVTVFVTSVIGSQAVVARNEYVPTGPRGTAVYSGQLAPPDSQVSRAAEVLQARLVGRATGLGLPIDVTGGPEVINAVADNATLRCVDENDSVAESEQRQARIEDCARRHGGLEPFPAVAAVDQPFVEIALGRPLSGAERTAFEAGTALVIDPRIDVSDGSLSLRPIGFRSVTGPGTPAPGQDPAVVRVPALAVQTGPSQGLPLVLVEADHAAQHGLRPVAQSTVLFAPQVVPAERSEDLARALLSAGDGTSAFSVERGPEGERLLLRILALVAGILVLATLAVVAMAVALSAGQLRQDFATLAAVGAAPRLRRRIVAAQSGLLAGVGVGAGLLAGSVGGVLVAGTRGDPLWPRAWMVTGVIALVSVAAAMVIGAASGPRGLSMQRRLG